MLLAVQIIISKTMTKICHIFKKNASVLPGYIAYLLNNRVLDKVKYPRYVIVVTGSSGKGSTTALIAHILKTSGYKVVYNESGSNIINAITTLVLNHCNLFGKMTCDVLLLEADEKHLHLFGKNKMTHLVLTNITRDQTARNGSPDLVYDSIIHCVDDQTTIILNADDPMLQKTKLQFPGKIITYGLAKTKDSLQSPQNKSIDNAYCPNCHKKLIYHYYHYGHLGSYYCRNCDFKRGKVDYEAQKVDLENQTMTIQKEEIHLSKNILYVAYATTAAYALCDTIHIDREKIKEALNQKSLSAKRGKEYTLAGKKVTMLESKNENPLSYYQSLKYITKEPGIKTVILGFDNVSRRYQENDLSWLWDVDFELLNDEKIDKILCIGRFKYDVLTRLSYANVPKEKCIIVENLNDIPAITKKTKGNIYTMVCFDMTAILHKIMEEEHGNN